MTTTATIKDILNKIAVALKRALTRTEANKITEALKGKPPLGYFIDPKQTPQSTIDWKKAKAQGWDVAAIRVSNDGTYGYKPSQLKYIGTGLDGARIEKWAWVWDGFTQTKEVVNAGWNVLIDMETYDMNSKLAQLKQVAKDVGNKGLIICIKPPGWDGDQKVDKLVKLLPRNGRIAFMTYTGDYNKTNAELRALYKAWDNKYPGKFIACLETYMSDNNVTAKTVSRLQLEIDAVSPYVSGILLFRYGLSNYHVKDVYKNPNTTTKSTTQTQVEKSLGVTFTNFTEFYNIIKNSKDYAYYYDDKFTFQEVLNKKFNYLNCVDICQAGVKLANSMPGYTAVPYGIYCSGYGVNHAIFSIVGNEFKVPTWIDLAAASSDNYSIGYHWCDGALTKEPGWIPYE